MKENEDQPIKYIPYKGKRFRDDRMYVFNIVKGNLEKHSSKGVQIKEGYWVLYYLNSLELPLADKKFFETKEEAESSVKHNEPLTPLISNYEEPDDVFQQEDGWDLWQQWLNFKRLKSAVTGYQNLPFNVTLDGGSFEIPNNYTDIWIEEDSIH